MLKTILTRDLGKKIERFALNFLKNHKLQLIESNYHSRYGEIDLIMLHQDCLVFIEVRYRKDLRFGSGAETVDYNKQQKIIKTAQVFLQNMKKYQQLNCRFDVVSVTLDNNNLQANWLKDAFQVSAW
ncbi:MAG: YraN family protein [Kangiellaceae bacterium]|nr:YraN family protein [Kangiellaceae bacterium]